MSDFFTREWIQHWKKNSLKSSSAVLLFLRRFSRKLPAVRVLNQAHHSVFDEFDCLQCANCCKHSQPVFNRTDITRIAGFLGMAEREMELNYLKADADGDFVPMAKPCPFLNPDNHCRVYEVRPKSCRGFPHTDSPEAWSRPALLAGNAKACPAAFAIVEKFRKSAY